MDFAQKVTVPFTKRIFYSFSKNKNTSRYRGVRLEQLAQLPSDLTEPRLASKTPFFVRGVSVVNWMVQNPWILENQPLSIPRYEFSESRPLFKYEVVQISRAGEPADYLVASISKLGNEIVLKVTDLFPQSKFSAEHFYLALLDLADRHQADVWTCVPQELEIFFSGAKLAQLKKSREYIFWSGQNGCMAKVHKDLQFAPGDGDAAFW